MICASYDTRSIRRFASECSGRFFALFDFWKIAHKGVQSKGKTLVLPFFSYSAKIYAKREKKVP